jgi:hypothetical protein
MGKASDRDRRATVRRALVVAVALFLGGCATMDAKVKSWIGHHQSEVIRSWGVPTRVFPDGRGGAILMYDGCHQNEGHAWRNSDGSISYTDPERRCSTHTRFFADDEGRIYDADWSFVPFGD